MPTQEAKCFLLFIIFTITRISTGENIYAGMGLDVLKYTLWLDPTVEDQTINGNVEVFARVRRPIKTIYLNVEDISLSSKPIQVLSKGQFLRVTDSRIEKDLLIISLAKPITEKSYLKVRISYLAKLTGYEDSQTGAYSIQVTTDTDPKNLLIATQFAPAYARQVLPCVDAPRERASLLLRLAAPPTYTVLSNSPLSIQAQHKKKEGWTWHYFKITPSLPAYLYAFVIGHFAPSGSSIIDGINVTVWTRGGPTPLADVPNAMGWRVVKTLTEYFDLQLPMTKMDIICLPRLKFSAMENWGLITAKESVMLTRYPPPGSGDWDRVALVAHEISHHWTGDLVTFSRWPFVWLSEGLATFFEFLSLERIKHDLRETGVVDSSTEEILDSKRDILLGAVIAMLHLEEGIFQEPLQHPTLHRTDIDGVYRKLIYLKGAAIARMLQLTLGAEVFQRGLQIYLTKNYLQSASTTDFLRSLSAAFVEVHEESVSMPPLPRLFSSWGSKPGFPLLTVRRINGSVIELRQEVFEVTKKHSMPYIDDILRNVSYTHPQNIPFEKYPTNCNISAVEEKVRILSTSAQPRMSPETTSKRRRKIPALWSIPITFTTAKDPQFCTTTTLWMQSESLVIELQEEINNDEWILFNLEMAAYCRVQYDDLNWKLLSRQLKENHRIFSPYTRAQLIDDAFALVRAGNLSPDIAEELTEYISKEEHFIPIETIKQISFLQ